MEYDLAIIGGGPAGYTAAERAGENGLRTVLFEEREIGGVCLNQGCIPAKTLLYSAKVLENIRTAPKYGITPGGDPSFDLAGIQSRKERVVKRLVSGVKMKLDASGVIIVGAKASIEGEANGRISILAGGEKYSASYLILCTGSENWVPEVPGLERDAYWDSTQVLDAKQLPATITIIGAGVIGMEFASMFNSFGVKVNVVELAGEILGTADSDIAAMARSEYSKRGVNFYLGAMVTEVKNGNITIKTAEKEESFESGQIVVAVGRKAVTAGLGIEALGLKTWAKGVEVDAGMRTSHPKVYACGDITGSWMLAHEAIREAEAAVNNILGVSDTVNYDCVPSVVYTNPEIAFVGRTAREMEAAKLYYREIKLPMTYSGRFMAENEQFSGLCKLIMGSGDIVAGCQMIGNPASEIIVLAAMAIDLKLSLDEFKKVVFPHPTVGEVLKESFYL